MAEEIRNKFVSWTLNVTSSASSMKQQRARRGGVIGGISIGGGGGGGGGRRGGVGIGQLCGVGVNLALYSPPPPSSSSSSSSLATRPSSASRNNRVVIDSVVPDGPAYRAGLRRGDVISSVDGISFDRGVLRDIDLVPDDVASAIRGIGGTEVVLVVERNDLDSKNSDSDGRRRRLIEFVLVREPIGLIPPAHDGTPASSSASSVSTTRDGEAIVDGGGEKATMDAKLRRPSFAARGASVVTVAVGSDSLAPHSFPEEKEDDEDYDDDDDDEEEEEEEGKERDMASSAESADQFDDDAAPPAPTALVASPPQSASVEGEEKTNIEDDDDDANGPSVEDEGASSVACSVDDASSQQWEMLSERSGSAIVVSFSGSYCGSSSCYRSPSPSVPKNKFVLVESNGEPYLHHVVLPTDTLQGLCLAYKISATRLRMENNFSGNSLHMAPKRLRIPNVAAVGGAYDRGAMIRIQDRTSREYKLHAFVAEMPSMELVEAKAYLDLSNWDLDEAIRSAREDEGWDLRGGFEPLGGVNATVNSTAALDRFGGGGGGGVGGGDDPMTMYAVTKPKALTARDIYACPPPFDGHGFELKDIKR
ncbi:hypothetical protein ACHAXA_001801 [Cyclostephanos tholiformis]|uniref:PDZ domain-containing protein n=1 Tax=Cyclostephanos tholiformis TaxID=382380 RepID=A0ABD3SE35_9STRA